MEKKTIKIIYWVITILFVLFMSFGAVTELMQLPDAQKVIVDLGYPVYLNYILGVAKILGVIALIQWVCKELKEWAYAGFTIDIIGASASTFFVTHDIVMSLVTLAFLVPLGISYWLWKKMDAKA